MFSFSTRPIIAYAYTGGFFIFVQMTLLVWLIPDSYIANLSSSTKLTSEQIADLAPAIQSALTSLLVAVALLSIFFFGVILDLIGSLYVFWEVRVFHEYVKRNKNWLIDYMRANFGTYIQDDFNNILSQVFYSFYSNITFSWLRLWRRSERESIYQDLKAFSLLAAKQRAEQILILHAFNCQNASCINLLNERLELCRFSRAITTSLLITALEMYLLTTYRLYNRPPTLYLVSIIIFVMTMLAVFMTIRAYSRLCLTLFAMVYTQMRSEQDQKKILEQQDADNVSTDEMTNPQELQRAG